MAIFLALLVAGTVYFAAVSGCGGRDGLYAVQPNQHRTGIRCCTPLDLLVPLVGLGHERAWDPVGADKTVTLVLLLSGWVFATTIIAAAGRAISRA